MNLSRLRTDADHLATLTSGGGHQPVLRGPALKEGGDRVSSLFFSEAGVFSCSQTEAHPQLLGLSSSEVGHPGPLGPPESREPISTVSSQMHTCTLLADAESQEDTELWAVPAAMLAWEALSGVAKQFWKGLEGHQSGLTKG